jgi:hypothetical protein
MPPNFTNQCVPYFPVSPSTHAYFLTSDTSQHFLTEQVDEHHRQTQL